MVAVIQAPHLQGTIATTPIVPKVHNQVKAKTVMWISKKNPPVR